MLNRQPDFPPAVLVGYVCNLASLVPAETPNRDEYANAVKPLLDDAGDLG